MGSILQADTFDVVGGNGCCGNRGGPVATVTIFGECKGDETTGLLENKCGGWGVVDPNPAVYCKFVGADIVVAVTTTEPGLMELNAVVIGRGWFGSIV